MNLETCPGCRVGIGEHHKHGCDWEECPICHAQCNACNCDIPVLLNVTLAEARVIDEQGLNTEQGERWDKILREQGLIPWGSELRLKDL